MHIGIKVASFVLVGLIACCAPPPAPTPPPRQPAPQPRPVPPPPPAPAPRTADWVDMPLTPGDWRYSPDSGEAAFVMAGGAPALVVRCDSSARRVELVRPAGGGAQIRIRTSSAQRSLAGTPAAGGVTANLAASDPLLDAIAFSRGRFTVQSDSGAMLVLPAWPEIARVVEDCRG